MLHRQSTSKRDGWALLLVLLLLLMSSISCSTMYDGSVAGSVTYRKHKRGQLLIHPSQAIPVSSSVFYCFSCYHHRRHCRLFCLQVVHFKHSLSTLLISSTTFNSVERHSQRILQHHQLIENSREKYWENSWEQLLVKCLLLIHLDSILRKHSWNFSIPFLAKLLKHNSEKYSEKSSREILREYFPENNWRKTRKNSWRNKFQVKKIQIPDKILKNFVGKKAFFWINFEKKFCRKPWENFPQNFRG